MKRVLIAYYSTSGKAEQMAQYIAEGVALTDWRLCKETKDIQEADELSKYDGYILGSPTFSPRYTETNANFLGILKKIDLEGKLAGALDLTGTMSGISTITMLLLLYLKFYAMRIEWNHLNWVRSVCRKQS